MRSPKFNDSQIHAILKQYDAGIPVTDLCREHGMSSASFYKWRAKYGGMDVSMMKELKELRAENSRLKKMRVAIAHCDACAIALCATPGWAPKVSGTRR